MKKVTNSRFETVGNLRSVILICDDKTEVLIPAEAFVALAPRAKQFLSSTNTKPVVGEWVSGRYHSASQVRTGQTDTGWVALQFDPGTDNEICIALRPATARELGQRLIDMHMLSSPTRSN